MTIIRDGISFIKRMFSQTQAEVAQRASQSSGYKHLRAARSLVLRHYPQRRTKRLYGTKAQEIRNLLEIPAAYYGDCPARVKISRTDTSCVISSRLAEPSSCHFVAQDGYLTRTLNRPDGTQQIITLDPLMNVQTSDTRFVLQPQAVTPYEKTLYASVLIKMARAILPIAYAEVPLTKPTKPWKPLHEEPIVDTSHEAFSAQLVGLGVEQLQAATIEHYFPAPKRAKGAQALSK